jgi:uncharacterized protein YbjQ (UPF0145 family)
MRYIKIIVMALFFSILMGCATGSYIITGNARPAIDPNGVKIYLAEPSRFETIGIVQASSDVEFSTQKAQDRVINELKKQAAKIGANGVILMNTGNTSSGGVFMSGVYIANETMTARGQAIYVIQE